MPELPEVESVRSGLARHLTGRTIGGVEVFDPRSLRRQAGGAEEFVRRLSGRTMTAAVRRGKFLWLHLDDGRALSAHLGMSGQLLVRGTSAGTSPGAERTRDADSDEGSAVRHADPAAIRAPTLVRELSTRPRHLRVRLHLVPVDGDAPGGAAVELVDQRIFGGLHVTDLVPTPDGAPGGMGSPAALLPISAGHIARDLLDPALDRQDVVMRMRSSSRAVKTILLDQRIVSGVGNIYADEGLWAAHVHGARPGARLGPRIARRLLEQTAAVMERALAVGGTSFDSLYVDTDGTAGFFARELAAYGRAGRPCRRCDALMRSEVVGGRSHTFCPKCQTRPR